MTLTDIDTEVHLSGVERAKRTLWPALGFDVLVAVAIVVASWVEDADLTSSGDWKLLAVLAAKTAISAVASYIMRLRSEPVYG